MDANKTFINKLEERLDGNNVDYVVYGEINKSKTNLIKLGSEDKKTLCLAIVTVVKDTMFVVTLDKETNLNKLTKIDLNNVENVKFKSYSFGIGRRMTINMKDGSCLEIKFIKKVFGMTDQKNSLKQMEEDILAKVKEEK